MGPFISHQVSSIRRSPTNPEVVSVQYNMFEDNTVLDAEQVVVTTGKLSDGELVYVMGYMVRMDSYFVDTSYSCVVICFCFSSRSSLVL